MNNTHKKLFPANIRSVAVTAPAGPVAPQDLAAAMQILHSLDVKILNYLPANATDDVPEYLSASSSERIRLLNAAIRDPETDLILCVRGGFGCMHLLNQIDYQTLRQRKLPVMGYSDITALHCAMLSKKAGMAIAGTNLMTLQQILPDDFSCQSHLAALSSDKLPHVLTAPQILQPLNQAASSINPVKAHAYAANLTVLAALCGSEFMPDFQNMILILEDINEPLYKLDRLLTQLQLNRSFDRLSALVFGSFTGGGEPAGLEKLLGNIAGMVGCACFKNFTFGHVFPMCAINSTRQLTLQANSNILTVS